MTFHMYEREVRFFRNLAYRMQEGVPNCYAAEIDVATGDHVLGLEDLEGYRPGDQAAGCGLEETERCLTVMARLHAAWWGAEHPYAHQLGDAREAADSHGLPLESDPSTSGAVHARTGA